MRSRAFLLVLSTALLLGLAAVVTAPVASAQTNSIQVKSNAAPGWTAFIGTNKKDGLKGCSGTIIGYKWVLTAAHCVSETDGKVQVPAESVHVILNRTSTGTGQLTNVDEIIRPKSYPATPGTDVALLHVTDFNESMLRALPLAFEPGAVNTRGGISFFGYGAQSTGNRPADPAPLQKTPDGAYLRTPSCDSKLRGAPGQICYSPSTQLPIARGGVSLLGGDSGSPAAQWRFGAWQLQAVADTAENVNKITKSSPPARVGATSILGSGLSAEGFPTIRDWVIEHTGIPTGSSYSNELLSNRAGQLWLVGSDGYRHRVAAAASIKCLAGGRRVEHLRQIDIDSIPEKLGSSARCA